MSFFVVATQNEDDELLDSPLFQSKDGTSAVAVFLSSESASTFIREAGWGKDEVAAELQPTQALKWLVHAHQQGVDHVAVDPSRDDQLAGKPQRALSLEDPYQAHAELLRHLGDSVDGN